MKSFVKMYLFRVYEFFNKQKDDIAKVKTINFFCLLEMSLLVPPGIIVNKMFSIIGDGGVNDEVRYIVGISLAVITLVFNYIFLQRYLSDEKLEQLKIEYQKPKYAIPMWLLFSLPIIMVFGFPIIYGVFTGTITSPLLVRLLNK